MAETIIFLLIPFIFEERSVIVKYPITDYNPKYTGFFMHLIKIPLLLSAIGFCQFCHGQKNHEFGAFLSYENATTQFDADNFDINVDAKSGFGARLYYYSRFFPFLGLRTEIGYVGWGGKSNINNTNVEQSLNYLLVPTLMVQVNILFIRAYAGPQVGFLLSANTRTNGMEMDNKQDFKGTDISGVAGVEVTLPLHIIAGGRYNLGSTDISDIGTASYKNRAFSIYAGIHF